MNLIDNAVKFSPRGTSVRVEAEATPAGEARISVADRGKGIPEKYHDKVFERFFRVPRTQRKGSGLGLAIVKLVVESWGGRIELESRSGRGTVFQVFLPLASDTEE